MNRRSPSDNLETCTRDVLAFEQRFSRRLRDARDALVAELNSSEMEIFSELRHGPRTVTFLSWRLGRDKGYLSRTLKYLALEGHTRTCTSARDGREREVELTEQGRRVAQELDRQSRDRVRRGLQDLPMRQRRRLSRAMATILEILDRDWLTNLLESTEEQATRELASKISRAERRRNAPQSRRQRPSRG